MPTSGTISFNLTARQVITFALRKIRVIGEGEDPTAAQAADAVTELNLLLKEWQRYPSLWRLTEGTLPLVADTYSYALNTPTAIPHRIISARYRDANGRTLPMELIDRDEYYDLPETTTGIPTSFYVDYQRDAPTVFLWQAPASVTSEAITYTYLRKFQDISSLDDEIDVRSEHLSAVGYALAERIADDYGKSGATVDRVTQRAIVLLEQALDADRPDFVQFVPGYTHYG